MNKSLYDGNGDDTYTVSQNAPFSELIEHMADTYTDALMLVADLENLRSMLAFATDDAAIAAREGGATWEQIAAALGVTRQAAHARLADLL